MAFYTPRKHVCPACRGLHGVEIIYGLPDFDALKDVDSSDYKLGGCIVSIGPDGSFGSPNRHCRACGHEWYETELAVPIVATPSVAIAGSAERLPVRRIFCVGQNYADHTREMGGDPARQAPFFFTKPGDAVVDSGAELAFPTETADLHHEVELVIAIGKGGRNIAAGDAAGHIFGHGVGIDLTRRDLQAVAKAAGRPWDMAKGFDESAPTGPIKPGVPPATAAIALTVDGETRQSGNIDQMIWSVAEIVAALSRFVALAPGDLIFTGTPAGVGPIRPGQAVRGTIEGVDPVEIRYAS